MQHLQNINNSQQKAPRNPPIYLFTIKKCTQFTILNLHFIYKHTYFFPLSKFKTGEGDKELRLYKGEKKKKKKKKTPF